MPTARTTRQRQLAIDRKAHHETNFLFAEEDDYNMPPPLKLKDERPEELISKPSSPVSVASTLDIMGEIKSLVLPGAWVVVGKGGRPLKNDKMYDEPIAMLTAKKQKKKKKTRKAAPEPEPLLVILEEAGSSSKCLRELERSTVQRSKQVTRAKDAKYWAGYQHAKQLQRAALDELAAALADDQAEDSAGGLPKLLSEKPMKDNKANSEKAKARRRARSAAAINRCFIWDDDEQQADLPVSIERGMAKAAPLRSGRAPFETRLSGELQLCFGRDGQSGSTEPRPPGAWTTVGKRGKAVSDFPPLKPNDKADKPGKQRTAPEQSDVKRLKTADKHGKGNSMGNKCSIM